MLGKQRLVALWSVLASQPNSFNRLPARERPCLKVKLREDKQMDRT